MKLKQIEEIATKQVPIWQPALLVILLLAGYFVVPIIAKQAQPPAPKAQSFSTTLGVNTIKEQLNNGVQNIAKPLATQLANQVQKEAGIVLGLAQSAVSQTVQNVASQSGPIAKEFLFDNTLGKLLQNINSLPSDQQDLIKKAICK